MPFDDDEVDLKKTSFQPKVKLKEQKTVQSPVEQERVFNEQANGAHQRDEEYKVRAAELAQRYRDVIKNTILIENKSEIQKNLEQEVLNHLIALASEINNDPGQKEGEGSNGLIGLLFKTVLHQRDRLNNLEYRLQSLEKTKSSQNG